MKKRIYLNEINMMMGSATYFPLVFGLLRANADWRPAGQSLPMTAAE